MYVSDKPNYYLMQTLLDSLQQDLQLLVDPPDGSKEHPATTCLELWLCHPEYSSGQFQKQWSDSFNFGNHWACLNSILINVFGH